LFFQCENLNDSEHMTWVLINHVRDLIELSQEPPVQDFIRFVPTQWFLNAHQFLLDGNNILIFVYSTISDTVFLPEDKSCLSLRLRANWRLLDVIVTQVTTSPY